MIEYLVPSVIGIVAGYLLYSAYKDSSVDGSVKSTENVIDPLVDVEWASSLIQPTCRVCGGRILTCSVRDSDIKLTPDIQLAMLSSDGAYNWIVKRKYYEKCDNGCFFIEHDGSYYDTVGGQSDVRLQMYHIDRIRYVNHLNILKDIADEWQLECDWRSANINIMNNQMMLDKVKKIVEESS